MDKLAKIFLVIISIISYSKDVYGQVITWQKLYGNPNYDNYAYSGIQTFDGGYVISGESHEGTLVVKTDQYGDTVWTKLFKGRIFYSIIQAADSNFVLVGDITNDTIFFSRGYLLKINSHGNFMWDKFYGGMFYSSIQDIIEVENGNLVMVGTTEYNLPPPLLRNIYLIKTEKNGKEIWSRIYDSTGVGNSISNLPRKGFLISGTTELLVDYDGNIKYIKKDLGNGIPANDFNGFIFMKNFDSSGTRFIRIIKTDSVFSQQWIIDILFGNLFGYGNAILSCNKGYIIAGELLQLDGDSDPIFMKINPVGDIIWNRNFGPRPEYNEAILDVSGCSDSGFIAVGFNSPFKNGVSKYYVVKTDKDGNTTPLSIKQISENTPSGIRLYQNFPNPFNSQTVIGFSVNELSKIKICIYNILGQLKEVILEGVKPSGEYTINYSPQGFASGIYFYVLSVNNKSGTNDTVCKNFLFLK